MYLWSNVTSVSPISFIKAEEEYITSLLIETKLQSNPSQIMNNISLDRNHADHGLWHHHQQEQQQEQQEQQEQQQQPEQVPRVVL